MLAKANTGDANRYENLIYYQGRKKKLRRKALRKYKM